jgi:hypothetical protein
MPFVFPCHFGWKRHQDGFYPSSRLETEEGASVVNEVEFHITASSVALEVLVAFLERMICPVLNNWKISVGVGVAYTFKKSESVIKSTFGEVVEKDASDPPWFVSVLEIKVFVAPFF